MQTFPERVHLEEDETILAVVRKHWFILFAELFIPVAIFFIPLIAYLGFHETSIVGNFIQRFPETDAVALFLFSAWGLVIWMILFYTWTDYYLDVWTITDRRIIAVNQLGLFRRTTASFRLERLQDVHIEIHGLIATLLGFGTIRTQTAGQEVDFIIKGIPQPEEVKALILRSADTLLSERHAAIKSARAHSSVS
jgi:uncharacterized membrane protein YdbT with pleckstrin-like domain